MSTITMPYQSTNTCFICENPASNVIFSPIDDVFSITTAQQYLACADCYEVVRTDIIPKDKLHAGIISKYNYNGNDTEGVLSNQGGECKNPMMVLLTMMVLMMVLLMMVLMMVLLMMVLLMMVLMMVLLMMVLMMVLLTMVLLTMMVLMMVLLTMMVLMTMVLLTMVLLTMVLLTMVLLTEIDIEPIQTNRSTILFQCFL